MRSRNNAKAKSGISAGVTDWNSTALVAVVCLMPT